MAFGKIPAIRDVIMANIGRIDVDDVRRAVGYGREWMP